MKKTLKKIKSKVTNAVGTALAGHKIIASKRAIKAVDRDVKAIRKARAYDKAPNSVPGAIQARTNAEFAKMSVAKRNRKWAKKK